MSKQCKFCEIVSEHSPASVVYEDEKVMCFMTLRPTREGECVIIPKEHIDHFTDIPDELAAHITLNNRRTTAAFLLKGPSHFSPMKLNHLGKNNDQIVRLAKEPAQVLFVQHCHEVTPAVRETLRAFAVQPGNPRRFCIIDGKDSIRLLKAYGLLDKAKELSDNS